MHINVICSVLHFWPWYRMVVRELDVIQELEKSGSALKGGQSDKNSAEVGVESIQFY